MKGTLALMLSKHEMSFCDFDYVLSDMNNYLVDFKAGLLFGSTKGHDGRTPRMKEGHLE